MSSAEPPVESEPVPPDAAEARARATRMAGRKAIVSARRTYVEMNGALGLETTLMAWTRTATAAMALGFFLSRAEIAAGPLLRAVGLRHAGVVLGLGVIGFATLGSGVAALRYLAAHRDVRAGVRRRPTAFGPAAVGFGAAVVGLGVLALLLALRAPAP
jgi:uncharacterized membrane protein YidH (DUF202 family)